MEKNISSLKFKAIVEENDINIGDHKSKPIGKLKIKKSEATFLVDWRTTVFSYKKYKKKIF